MGTKSDTKDGVKREDLMLTVANFGYTVVNIIDNIDVYDLKLSQIKQNESLAIAEEFLIPNFKEHSKSEVYKLDFRKYRNDFKRLKIEGLEGGIAREFSKINPNSFKYNLKDESNNEMSNDLSKDKFRLEPKTNYSDIIAFANKYGLLTNDYSFLYKENEPNDTGAFCDKLSDWHTCWNDVRLILYVFDNYDKLKLKDFNTVNVKDGEIKKLWFHNRKEELSSWNLAFSWQAIGKEIKSKIGLETYKILLKHTAIFLLNENLCDSTFLAAKFDVNNPDIEKVYMARNAKGVIFLDLAKYIWKIPFIRKCDVCKEDMDVTNKRINYRFHPECYNFHKGRLKRDRANGMTDIEIAKKYNLKLESVIRQRPFKKIKLKNIIQF